MWFPFLDVADLGAAVQAAFEDPDAAVRDASYRVKAELATAIFAVNQDGNPAEQSVTDAIKDATRAQLAFWAETGDLTGAGAQIGGGSILSVSLPGGGGTTNLNAKRDARTAPAVTEILRNADGIAWDVQY